MILENLELLVMAAGAMLFITMLTVAGMDSRLRRIEKKLKVLVPDAPRKPLVVVPEKFRDAP
jgi:hypothetical protein